MCGIAGYFGRGAFDHKRFLNALRHRGPDANGVWQAALPHQTSVHLVHARLKVLDLTEAAAQPMVRVSPLGRAQLAGSEDPGSSDDAVVLVFNGAIYNFLALRGELEAKGHRFRSTGDTEVLLAGFIEWGMELFVRLDGMFALALYDGPGRRLIFARDHAGIKPLYFARTGQGGIVFASEVRALSSSRLCGTTLDLEATGDFLRLGSFSEPATLFREIRSFPPGHAGVVRLDEGVPATLTTQPFWLPERIGVNPQLIKSAWREEHAARLIESVREQLVADVPVGVFLSGGIDSSLILELAAAGGYRDRMVAFTLAGRATEHDEAAIARRTARAAGVKHTVVELDEKDLPEWVMGGLDAMDLPSADGLNLYLISRAARAHGLVAVLSGTGADELHGAYGHPRSLGRVIRLFRSAGALRPSLAKLAGKVIGAARGSVRADRLSELLAAVPSSWRVLQEKRRFFTRRQLEEIWTTDNAVEDGPPPYHDAEAFQHQGIEEQIRLGEIRGYLLNTLLRDGDWATMANHQELRVPFLGRRYMECILQAPESFTASDNGPKPQLIPLLSPSARHLATLPKRGFTLDYVAWLSGPLRTEFFRAVEALRDGLGFRIDAEARLHGLRQSRSQKEARRLWALFALGRYLAALGDVRRAPLLQGCELP